MPAKKDPAAELAGRMTQVLEDQRGLGGAAYPLPLRRLAELADPQAPSDLVLKAVTKRPFTERALTVNKKDLLSPVVLRVDLEQLAASPMLLEFVLGTLCSPDQPATPLTKVKTLVAPELKQPFEEAVGRQIREGTLPAAVGHVLIKNKPYLYLQHMPPPPPPPPKKKPEIALAEQLVQSLQAQRNLGQDSYPLSLGRLVELTDPAAHSGLVKKAVGKEPFSNQVLVAQKNNPDAPVALREDADQLAASPRLLEFVLRAACTPAHPTVSVAKLKGKVSPELRESLENAVNRQIEGNALPPNVEWVQEKKSKVLHPLWVPLRKEPAVELATRMVQLLVAQRGLGADSYPPRLKRLVELAEPHAPPALLKKALATEVFRSRAVALLKSYPDSPIAFIEDLDKVAGSPLLLEGALEAARNQEPQAFTVGELKKKVIPELQQPFADAVNQRVAGRSLPPTVGWVAYRKSKLFFRMADVQGNHQAVGGALPAPTAPATVPVQARTSEGQIPPEWANFGTAFDEAFLRLDRQAGSHNFVSLVDLRRALPLDRATWDAGLRKLRLAGRYSLSAAEGRHGISPEEREAGIIEEGALLLFVSRRSS